jgi:hypothetical protein
MWWVIAIAVVLILLVVVILAEAVKPAPMPYGAFLDQLEAGNVASITFQGTEIDGRFKRAVDSAIPTGTVQRDTFSKRRYRQSCARHPTAPQRSCVRGRDRRCDSWLWKDIWR